MEVLLGFLIAMAVGLTGVGAGSIAAPVFILFLGLPPAQAVGTALIYGAVIKLVAAPAYLWHGQVNFRVLSWLLAGGLPGTIAGTLLLRHLDPSRGTGLLYGVLGVTIVAGAVLNVWRAGNHTSGTHSRDRTRWLPWIALPIGAEVGFSSAGAGAIGSLALLGLTNLAPAAVVGTDMFFGLGLSLVGGGFQFATRNYDPRALELLVGSGVVGVLAGAMLGARLPARKLRLALSAWLIAVGIQLCYRSLAG